MPQAPISFTANKASSIKSDKKYKDKIVRAVGFTRNFTNFSARDLALQINPQFHADEINWIEHIITAVPEIL
jgi:hypothetical protein